MLPQRQLDMLRRKSEAIQKPIPFSKPYCCRGLAFI